jgi:hypothetical protein
MTSKAPGPLYPDGWNQILGGLDSWYDWLLLPPGQPVGLDPRHEAFLMDSVRRGDSMLIRRAG